MSCKPITFHNVPPEVFNCMKKKLQEAGIHVPPRNRGELSGSGIVADFEWDILRLQSRKNHLLSAVILQPGK